MNNSKKSLIGLFFLFITVSILVSIFLEDEKNNRIEEEVALKLKEYRMGYDTFYHKFQQRADLLFTTMIDKKELLELYKNAYKADKEEKAKIRAKLYDLLADDYNILKQYNLKQFHFHLPNNESFLRFHRPNKFGDSLSEARATVKYVNQNKKAIDGFEEGKVYNGFRFVYPIIYQDEHIGSVELSFDAYGMISEFMEHYQIIVSFLVSKDIVDKKVLFEEKGNYVKSDFQGFYYEKSHLEKIKKIDSSVNQISNDVKTYIEEHISKGKDFARYDKKNKNLIIVFPLKNPISKKVVGAVLINTKNNYIMNKSLNTLLVSSSLIFLLSIIFTVIYFELSVKNKLKVNNKKLQTLIDEVNSGIAILDLEGNFLEVNPTYTKLFGYTQDEFKNINCVDLTHEDFKFLAIGALDEAKKNGYISNVRKTCIAKNGEKVYIEMSLNLLPNKQTFVSVANSLDDKIEMEKALNKFKNIYEYTSVGFLIVDEDRNIIDVNDRLLKLSGYEKKDELIGQSTKIFHLNDEQYNDYAKNIISKVSMNEMVRVEFQFRKKDGTTIWCEVSGSPLNEKAKLEDGRVLWAIVDVDDKVKAKELIIKQNKELQELNQNLNDEVKSQIDKIREKDMILIQKTKMASMGEMMDAVAHQWKQPLNIIKLSVDELEYLLKENKTDEEYLHDFGKRIKEQVNHSVETMDEFRDFFRPKGELQTTVLKDVIDSSLVLMKDELIKHTIVTKFEGDGNLEVNIIPNEFKHIIINIVNNAKDEFISKNLRERVIRFEVLKDDIYVILKIKDTAGGIPKDIINDIFKANFTTKPKGIGTGIGLYMTKNIIEKIGGSIEVNNIENGAEFIIRIPV